MKRLYPFLLLGAALLARIHAAEPSEAELIERGKSVAQAAFKEFSGQLMQAVSKGGFTNAIEFCSTQALPLTRKVAEVEGVEIRRVSHRPRNPANAASEQEGTLLKQFAQSLAAKEPPAPVIRRTDLGTAIFYAPITINNPLCLNCHGHPGRDIAADTLQVIQKKYPKDEATGFALNDLRGMWRIELPTKADN